MRYLTLNELLDLHHKIMQQAGQATAVFDLNALESSLAVPRMTFAEEDLYPTVVEKAAAMAYSLVLNHPFLDGNKRTGHAAMEVFLLLNGYELVAQVNEQEHVLLQVAVGALRRDMFTEWVRAHVVERS